MYKIKKMLYIFHVDTGRMITFEMNMALETVQSIKEHIERVFGLPAPNQVFLVSGGEILHSHARVCGYSSGTDTNPIYLFVTNFADSKCNAMQPWPSIDHAEIDFEKLVRQSAALPATYSTVVTRAQLAQQFNEAGRDEMKTCDRLVYEQHLQQQGWAAVIANLEDLTIEFHIRYDDFCRCFDEFFAKKDDYRALLESFDCDLSKLGRVPILPALISGAQGEFHGFDEYLYENESFTLSAAIVVADGEQPAKSQSSTGTIGDNVQDPCGSNSLKSKGVTLLQWITAKETHNSLEMVASNCLKQLESFDLDKMTTLRMQMQKTIENAEKEDIREIKGLKDRLQGLEKLMVEVKAKVQEQNELATAFQQNQARASNLGDASILPDLCETHSSQLNVMHKNNSDLRDIRRRISRAKDELGLNVMQRLKFIGHIQNKMSELDNQMLFAHRSLRRFQRHVVIIEQIHFAPTVYVTAVTEVVRRRTFSSLFLRWASSLAFQLQSVYNDEIEKRHEFEEIFDGHFLSTLFSGMDDIPPSYGTQVPPAFDSSLPNLTKEDLDILSACLPDVSSKIALPDLNTVIDFLITNTDNTNVKSEPFEKQQNILQNVLRLIDTRSHLKDEFESETDTEEFEKVGQSPMERRQLAYEAIQRSASQRLAKSQQQGQQQLQKSVTTSTEVITTKSIETSTEENLCTTRSECNRLKSLLKNMFELSTSTISLLRKQIETLKDSQSSNRKSIEMEFKKINDTWDQLKNEMQTNERELVNRLTVDHEHELNDVKKMLHNKTDELDIVYMQKVDLAAMITNMKNEHNGQLEAFKVTESECQTKIANLEEQLKQFKSEKERDLSDLRINLTREHKTEIEALRCRFKLMTNMERSPSDTSLEKIERHDVIDLIAHDSILMQTREDLEYERDIAIKEAVERERIKWETCRNTSIDGGPSAIQYKQLIDEKDRELEMMREREKVLIAENHQHKEVIQKLTEIEASAIVYTKCQTEGMQQSKVKYEKESGMERSRRIESESLLTAADKSSSMALIPGSGVATTTTTTTSGSRSKGHSSTSSSSSKNRLTLEGCTEGDIVVIVWNPVHGQYVVVQDTSILYFLHELSHQCLDLTYPTGSNFVPNKFHCVARIVSKEYCYAKKNDNRYRVSKGTRFYRINAVPLQSADKRSVTSTKRSGCSRQDRHDDRSTRQSTASQLLIDSFAQTDLISQSLISASSIAAGDRDMIDSGVVAPSQQKSCYKERNISVTEEDDVNLLVHEQPQHRYISVSEEDEIVDHPEDEERLTCATNTTTKSYTTTTTTTATTDTTDPDDSDEYRSLESKDGGDSMLTA